MARAGSGNRGTTGAHLAVALLLLMPLVLGYRFDAAVMAPLAERHSATWAMGSITAFIALMNNADAVMRDLSATTKVGSGGAPIAPSTGSSSRSTSALTSTTSTGSRRPPRRRTVSHGGGGRRWTRTAALCPEFRSW